MKTKLLYMLYRALFGALAWLPWCCLHILSDGLFLLFYRVIHYREKVARENIRRVFPELTDAEQEALLRRFYHYLCDLIVEIVKLFRLSEQELNARVEPAGTEVIDQYARQGHPVFVLMGHFGNWEWAQQMYRHLPLPRLKSQIYRPAHDQAFDRLMQAMRGRFDSLCIPQSAAVRTLLRLRREEGSFLCSFLADQHPNSAVMPHWTSFLGQDSPYITGPEEIGRRLDARYVYLDIERIARGRYRMTCRPVEPVAGVQFPYTIGYLRLMEQSIRRQPELWLWTHRRWYITREQYNREQSEKANPKPVTSKA